MSNTSYHHDSKGTTWQSLYPLQVTQLLLRMLDANVVAWLFDVLALPAHQFAYTIDMSAPNQTKIHRSALAQALNMMLFYENIQAVPMASAYVRDQQALGRQIVFDHGALRTVDWYCGDLPRGYLAFSRILEPLGYVVANDYPLTKLKMTGRAFQHEDDPEGVAQFFVSELHVAEFSQSFQAACSRILATSRDALTPKALLCLAELGTQHALSFRLAVDLLSVLRQCFSVRHTIPHLSDYELLLNESAEMAWIATEGNRFNHATDRVPDVVQVAQAQRELKRPIKSMIEVSQSGRVRQTAFRAANVQRYFIDDAGGLHAKMVPGSFFEFISRQCLPQSIDMPNAALDLSFDTSNAQGIFKMTTTS